MSGMHKPGVTLDQPVKRRSAAERFANLGDRIGRSFQSTMRTGDPEPELDYISDPEYATDEQPTSWYEVVPRFPIARSGYECAAVDEHIATLEQELSELDQELADLRARVPAQDEVATEIQRLGEQTSAILLAAHDKARDTTRQAQEQADRCIADAAANAVSITAEANRQREQIEEDVLRLASERGRLLADMETLAGTLATVAREASGRFAGISGPSAGAPGKPAGTAGKAAGAAGRSAGATGKAAGPAAVAAPDDPPSAS